MVKSVFDTISIYEDNTASYMPTVLYGKDVCFSTIARYPIKGNIQKIADKASIKMRQIDTTLDDQDVKYTPATLSFLAHLIMNDLFERITDKTKLEHMGAMVEVVWALDDHTNKYGDKYDQMDVAADMLKIIYDVVHF